VVEEEIVIKKIIFIVLGIAVQRADLETEERGLPA
jgi:hypothetical protein